MRPMLHLIRQTDATLEVAHGVLTPPERAQWERLVTPKRREEWLLGRLAAKQAIQRAEGLDRPLGAIAITPHDNGRPGFEGPAGWDLSISHGHGWAGALVAPGPAGLDLELLRPLPVKGWRFFLSPEEREWLAGEPLGTHGEVLAWALKEAAYKALHGSISGVYQLRLEVPQLGQARLSSVKGELVGRYARYEGLAIAIATPFAHAHWLDGLIWPGEITE